MFSKEQLIRMRDFAKELGFNDDLAHWQAELDKLEQRKDDFDEDVASPRGVLVGYVLVPTNFRISHIGAIHGVYGSKQEAHEARKELRFPQPEEVFIRPLYSRE